jgi:sporulation protein YlmC with PRC-barrel domain
MRIAPFAGGLAALLLGVSPIAVAQTAATPEPAAGVAYQELEDDDFIVQRWGLSVEDIEDLDLYTQDGEEIGEIEEVLVDADGQVRALTVEVGGFLGIGDREAIIEIDRLDRVDDQFQTSYTKEQLEQLPEWDD